MRRSMQKYRFIKYLQTHVQNIYLSLFKKIEFKGSPIFTSHSSIITDDLLNEWIYIEVPL